MNKIQLNIQIKHFLQNITITNSKEKEGLYINDIYNHFLKEYPNDNITKITFARNLNKIILEQNLKITKRKLNKGHQFYNIKINENFLKEKTTFLFDFFNISFTILTISLFTLEYNLNLLFHIL